MSRSMPKMRGVVKKVLSVGAGGGAIVALGTAPQKYTRVVIPFDKIVEQPYVGEVLTVWGRYDVHPVYNEQFHAHDVRAERPNIHELARFIGHHPRFAEMSTKRARHFVGKLGQSFIEALDKGDIATLVEAHLELRIAVALIQQWKLYFSTKRIAELLSTGGIRPSLATELVTLLGENAAERICKNPYLLVPFCKWREVDTLSRKIYRIPEKSEQRLIAAAESVVLLGEKAGRVAMTQKTFQELLAKNVGPQLAESARTAAVKAGRLVPLSSGGVEMIQGAGMSIVLRRFGERLRDFALQARLPNSSRTLTSPERTPTPSVVLLALPCMPAARFAAARDATERPLHIVATLSQRNAINAHWPRSAVTIAEVLGRLPNPPRKSHRSMFIHNCAGLDILTLAKLVQRLPLGGFLHLCFRWPVQPSSLPAVIAGEINSKLQLPDPHVIPTATQARGANSMANVSEALIRDEMPSFEKIQAGTTVTDGAAIVECAGVHEMFAEVKAAFYAGRSTGTAVVLVRTFAACRRYNIEFHNEQIAFLAASKRDHHFVYLRYREPATEEEPFVCNSHLHRLSVTKGTLGRIVEILVKPRLTIADSGPVRQCVRVHFESIGEAFLTAEELKTLSLGYALTLQRAQFSEWDHIIVPLESPRPIDRLWMSKAIASATRSILLVSAKKRHPGSLSTLDDPPNHPVRGRPSPIL